MLHNAQEEKTAGIRQIWFEKGEEIKTETRGNYILETVQNQREGKVVKGSPAGKAEVASELASVHEKDKGLRTAFRNLTPGKQREYSQYISEAKRASTKTSRLEKIIPMIREGRGSNDKYRK